MRPILCPQILGGALDVSTRLSARLTCRSWCSGVSGTVRAVQLSPALLHAVGAAPLLAALQRLPHLERVCIPLQLPQHILVQCAAAVASGRGCAESLRALAEAVLPGCRGYSGAAVSQLLHLVAEINVGRARPVMLEVGPEVVLRRVLVPGARFAQATTPVASGAAPQHLPQTALHLTVPDTVAAGGNPVAARRRGLAEGLAAALPALHRARVDGDWLLGALQLQHLSTLDELTLGISRCRVLCHKCGVPLLLLGVRRIYCKEQLAW